LAENHEYETIHSLLNESSAEFPKTALFEIAEKGVPLAKLVIGKPAGPQDAPHGGYMEPDLLAKALQEAKKKNWSAYRCFVKIF
jgi:hypothetical protein